MVIAKQMEVRSNIKEYFDMAYEGETIIVPRKQHKNIVIISESEYNALSSLRRLQSYAGRLSASTRKQTAQTGGSGLKEENLARLEEIKQLKDNWNGNGSPAIPSDVIEKTRTLLEDLPIQPEIFPTALMSIQLEFDNSRHDHMEIDISSGDMAEVFVVLYSGTESEESVSCSADSITERVLNFYG